LRTARPTYATGQRRWVGYCDTTGVDPYWDPAEHILVGFCCFLCLPTERSPEGLKHSTMKTYLYGVRHAHVIAGKKNPLEGCTMLETALRAIKRKQGVATKRGCLSPFHCCQL
jgi:hypothetical protein